MRTAAIINALAVFAAIFFLYISYGYYIDRTMETACQDSEEFLSNLAHATLSDLISNFDTPPEKLTQNYISPKITSIRKTEEIKDPLTFSQLETLYFVLGDYLEPEGCNLFTNLVKISQAKTILLYSEEFKEIDSTKLLSEIDKLPKKSELIDHTNPPAACGLKIDNPILEKKEPDYCKAIHEQNYFLVKQLELQVQTDDQTSQIYKATLANCFADCLNKEITCTENCWKNKLP